MNVQSASTAVAMAAASASKVVAANAVVVCKSAFRLPSVTARSSRFS